MASRHESSTTTGAPRTGGHPLPKRFPLASNGRRLSYERRIRLWLTSFALTSVFLTVILVQVLSGSRLLTLGVGLAVCFVWLISATYFFDQLIRPLQTLTNVVAALREDDFSFRARGARRGDTLGDLALEINALANTLQTQRSAARDALTLVERVMTSMPSPVLAFTRDGTLRLLNHAAEQAFQLERATAVGRPSNDLGLTPMLQVEDEAFYTHAATTSRTTDATRWAIRRTAFRLHGVPHTLFVLSDVASALREEERVAWQRIIRVLSHEINNSLTPIKSIAGTLRNRLPEFVDESEETSLSDFRRGLVVIEERAASLNRFLQAYQHLTRLPAPQLQPFLLQDLLGHLISLETRMPLTVRYGESVNVQADRDQLGQLLINLIRNAVDAATDPFTSANHEPEVILEVCNSEEEAIVQIHDNGPGLSNPANLFVPFYTTKPEGSGIGLVLARQIAVAHKGSLTLANRTDSQGCTAELRVPLSAPALPTIEPLSHQ